MWGGNIGWGTRGTWGDCTNLSVQCFSLSTFYMLRLVLGAWEKRRGTWWGPFMWEPGRQTTSFKLNMFQSKILPFYPQTLAYFCE